MNQKTALRPAFLTQAGVVAALYVVLTVFVNAFGLASGAIQVRLSEALCVLPVFTPAAVPGLFLGCLISNLVTGCAPWDVVFGSLATLLGALFTRLLRRMRFVYTLPPVFANAAIVPLVLIHVYGLEDAWWFLVLTVGAGEFISVCIVGWLLSLAMKKYQGTIFTA